MAKTVGELKKELEKFDDNMQLDFYAYCYDRNNYVCIQRDWDLRVMEKKPADISVYQNGDFVRIENSNSDDMEIGE